MPAHSKDASVRARRNKTTTRAKLVPQVNPKVPPLPKGTVWHQQVKDWWKRAWSSPMVPEWTESDVDALYLAAKLQQQFWAGKLNTAGELKALSGEIRMLLGQCGLTPMSRRSLQWEIERAEAAQESTTKRRAGAQPAKKATAPKQVADPRSRFKVVNGG